MTNVRRARKPSNQLQSRLRELQLTFRSAAPLAGVTWRTLSNWHRQANRIGDTAAAVRLCRAMQARAKDLGYDPRRYHESQVFPGQFPPPCEEVAA